MFGYCIHLYGGVISYAAKHLKVIALSSAEAEYAAASYACKEITFIRNICLDMGHKIDGPTILALDNQAAIRIAENHGVTGRTKHFTDAIHYVRHLVEYQVVRLQYIARKFQKADGFTKPLSKTDFTAWRKMILDA